MTTRIFTSRFDPMIVVVIRIDGSAATMEHVWTASEKSKMFKITAEQAEENIVGFENDSDWA